MNKIKKAVEISEAKISFVSLVDKAANKRQFLITKAEAGEAQFSTYGKILKVDDNTHYITGIVYEPMVEDSHGNFMTEDAIKKAAYWFAENGDKVDLQHSFEEAKGINVVENYVAPCDMNINSTPIVKGSWIMTVKVSNEKVWKSVQNGEITGFSMGGIGKYSEEDINLNKSETTTEDAKEKKSIFKKFAELLGSEIVEKDDSKDNKNTVISKEETGLDKNELQEMISRALEPIVSALDVMQSMLNEKSTDSVQEADKPEKKEEEENTLTAENVQKMVDDGINKALDPIVKALNARGVPSNLNDNKQTVEKTENHYLHGFL